MLIKILKTHFNKLYKKICCNCCRCVLERKIIVGMCFVVIHRGSFFIQGNMQIDNGEAAYAYAKQHGYDVRLWEMYGLNHFWELPADTRAEIKEFIKGLR